MLNTTSNENLGHQQDIEDQLAAFTEAESYKLGLLRDQWAEPIHDEFTEQQVSNTTILISGLTLAHDRFCCAALKGIGYRVKTLDCPDNDALRFGREFGNRGQCNPTYFTVGNLIKHLTYLRDDTGLSTESIIKKYIYLTAGACGPCRFGTYVTEYRKALRNAGFEGFRVLLFQQQGGIKFAAGTNEGLKIDFKFASSIVKAMIAGDVLNLMAYRLRPYETIPGSINKSIDQCKDMLAHALENDSYIIKALYQCRSILKQVDVDFTNTKPVVSIIGEFWAMTTEGDGNYHLQRFLENEGAEVDIQGVTNWILFMIWENRHDTLKRLELRHHDSAKKGLKNTHPAWKLLKLKVAEFAVRNTFKVYANILGLHHYHLPDVDHISSLAEKYFDKDVRGGEGFMEVGKLIYFNENKVNHMTISVKPFGCMPSSGVSDGVQSFVTAKWTDALFLPIETTGDGAVNIQSRIQMLLFKAKEKARHEFHFALEKNKISEIDFQLKIQNSLIWSHPFVRPRHLSPSIATNLIYAVSNEYQSE